jgi:SAM-dependent methyltransferase
LRSLGFTVIGIDSSEGMLRIARQHVPDGVFFQAEASRFALPQPVEAAVSLFDSLNHVLEPEQLQAAFQCVSQALSTEGIFVFDLNTEPAYGDRWDQSFCQVEADHAFFLRGGYDRSSRIGRTFVTMFRLTGTWQRDDVEIRQRPWEMAEVEPMLRAAGFSSIEHYRAQEDLGLCGHYGIGRVFVLCAKTNRTFDTRLAPQSNL